MFSKNLRYYRLKNAMTRKALAEKCHLSAMAISNYENGSRTPNMDTLKALAAALGVRVSDFLATHNADLVFVHGEFRKTSTLPVSRQEYVRESVEAYFSRFYTVLELLGGDILPTAPTCHTLPMSGDTESDALAMRKHLGLADSGPIKDLTSVLEDKGILVYPVDIDSRKFSGMNGFVNHRPYIVINSSMSPERNRSTIAHELAHLLFAWPEDLPEKDIEDTATAVSGAFLFPAADAVRELGLQRRKVSNDMALVCAEYGISMYMLAKRAELCKIITKDAARNFYHYASARGWQTREPIRIPQEKPVLFEQLVLRAVNEGEISIQRGAELLDIPYEKAVSLCCFEEG